MGSMELEWLMGVGLGLWLSRVQSLLIPHPHPLLQAQAQAFQTHLHRLLQWACSTATTPNLTNSPLQPLWDHSGQSQAYHLLQHTYPAAKLPPPIPT